MKYFFGFLASIGLIILTIVLIVRGFSGGNDKKVNAPAPLLDYANTSVEMQYTLDGPVNADQEHKAVRITVGQDESTIEILSGYNDDVVNAKTYSNNQAAYSEFLRALDIAGYTKGNTDASLKDERGYCPAGYRYSFDIVDGSSTKQHFWTTSCGSSSGNFKGKSNAIRALFEKQVPDYGKPGFRIN
jgi:hypothetical protein